MKDYQPIGQMLIAKGKLTSEQLDSALKQRKNYHQRLGTFLVMLGYVKEEDIAECLGEQFGFELIDPLQVTPDGDALQIIDPEFALSNRILPIRNTDESFECIVTDPIDIATTDTITHLVNKRTVFYIAPMTSLLSAIHQAYGIKVVTHERSKRPIDHKKKCMGQLDRNALLADIDAEIFKSKKPKLKYAVASKH